MLDRLVSRVLPQDFEILSCIGGSEFSNALDFGYSHSLTSSLLIQQDEID